MTGRIVWIAIALTVAGCAISVVCYEISGWLTGAGV
jgi:hypothetical protein